MNDEEAVIRVAIISGSAEYHKYIGLCEDIYKVAVCCNCHKEIMCLKRFVKDKKEV